MTEDEARQVVAAVRAAVDRGRHQDRVTLESAEVVPVDGEWAARLTFRQGHGPMLGILQTSLFSFIESDRDLTTDEMAGDLYLFGLVEPHGADGQADEDGIIWVD